MDQDPEFQKRLLATFAIEAQEHLRGITDALIALEQGAAPERLEGIVEAVFREAHSLKGAARAVNRTDIESVCQALEGVFAAVKRKEVALSAELFDLLQRGGDLLGRLLQARETKAEEGEGEPSSRRRIIEALAKAATATAPGSVESGRGGAGRTEPERQEPGPREPVPPEPHQRVPDLTPPPPQQQHPAPQDSALVSPLAEETVRVATAKLASLLLLSEEMVSAKLSSGQHVVQMRELRTAYGSWQKEWARILPDLAAAGAFVRRFAVDGGELSGEDGRSLLKVLEFLDWNAAFLKSLQTRSAIFLQSAERDGRTLGGMVDSLLEEVKKVMMFPFSSLLEAFPKIARDLARDHGKEVKLVVRGEELEIDRRILEELKDPLIHLVRNCISHGIELPLERERKRKPRRGTISIGIEPREGRAEVVVSDDGLGIDVEQLRSSLTRQGVITVEKGAEMSSAELLPFVFLSGVSTSPTVTEISGRGLGLAIVREKVEKLGGSVSLETEPEHGTSFRIVLPLSVATFRGILIRVADRLFVLPAIHVERAVRTKREEVATVENREIIDLGGRMVALARLADVLELGITDHLPEQLQAVVVTVGEQSVAFVVDEVLNEREVLMKRMGPQLSRVRNIAGATLLGSGKVVPILNVPDLIKSVTGGRLAAGPTMAPPAQEATRPRGRHILVVEDSITSRTLLKNILETAGYRVTTVVDGVEAMTRLKEGRFDLVVSDADMPRMNGFELTAKIRGDRDLNELPVVLVTALDSREDRERGVDAGASAYIVKSSFNQSDLLETVQRLC